MRILIYEYFSGGGLSNDPLAFSIFSEGFGILKCLISDFKADGHYIITILDSRISNLDFSKTKADKIIKIEKLNDLYSVIKKLSNNIDAAYIIAPEKNGILQKIIRLIENAKIISLNCTISGINCVSNKVNLYKFLKDNNIKTPKSIFFNTFDEMIIIKKTIQKNFSYPVLIKPSFGTDCEGIKIIEKESDLKKTIEQTRNKFGNSIFIIQEFIRGTNTSICFLNTINKFKAISLNKQYIFLGKREEKSEYKGGLIPYKSSLEKRAITSSKKIIKSIPGLTGLIGVDFIFTKNEVFVIEVNPRITTSYIGLREIININLAKAIINCKINQIAPNKIKHLGHVFFSKIRIQKILAEALEFNTFSNIISPIIEIGNDIVFSLISIKSKNKRELNKKIIAFQKKFKIDSLRR